MTTTTAIASHADHLIERSISHDEIAYDEYSPALAAELQRRSDGDVEHQPGDGPTIYEFWGTTETSLDEQGREIEGVTWRVHLTEAEQDAAIERLDRVYIIQTVSGDEWLIESADDAEDALRQYYGETGDAEAHRWVTPCADPADAEWLRDRGRAS